MESSPPSSPPPASGGGKRWGDLLDGQFKGKGVRIFSLLQRKDSTGIRIDVLEELKDINLASFCLLPEFIKVMSGYETHIVAD
jgi:hypothetical protein